MFFVLLDSHCVFGSRSAPLRQARQRCSRSMAKPPGRTATLLAARCGRSTRRDGAHAGAGGSLRRARALLRAQRVRRQRDRGAAPIVCVIPSRIGTESSSSAANHALGQSTRDGRLSTFLAGVMHHVHAHLVTRLAVWRRGGMAWTSLAVKTTAKLSDACQPAPRLRGRHDQSLAFSEPPGPAASRQSSASAVSGVASVLQCHQPRPSTPRPVVAFEQAL